MAERQTGRLTGIEASRGVAASLVVFYHAARHLDKTYGLPVLKSLFQFGHAGVDLFFVISGFIILHVHYRDIGDPSRLGHYLGRRFTRVMPIYWVVLVLYIAIGLMLGEGLPSLSVLVWSVSLLPSNSMLILDIAWTMRHEILFYGLFCLLILNRTAGMIGFGSWFALIALATLGTVHAGWLAKPIYAAWNLEFFFGMAVAQTLRTFDVPKPRLILLVGTLSFAAAALAENFGRLDGYADPSRLIYGASAALIVLGAAGSDRQGGMAIPSLLKVLGSASYSIYLFQFIFIGLLWKLWRVAGLDQITPHIASFPLLAVGGVLGGCLASRYIEYPLMRLVRGNRPRLPAPAAVG